MVRLTARQAEVLTCIRLFISQEGVAPSLREIGQMAGIRSTNGVSDHLVALERKGWVVIGRRGRARHMWLIEPPGALRARAEALRDRLVALPASSWLPLLEDAMTGPRSGCAGGR